MGASPWNADLVETGRQGEKGLGTGFEPPGTRALSVGSAAPLGAALTRVSGEGRGHVAATEERVASSQPPEDRTAAGLRESPRGLARRITMAPRTGALMTGRGTR